MTHALPRPESPEPSIAMHRIQRRLLSALALALAVLAAPAQNLAIKAGQVITRSGDPIENGTILIQDGVITAVGAEIEIPWDAVVIERPELVAFPGFVDADAPRGMDRANENLDVAPYLSVRDSVDPVNYFFENALRKGITTINVQQGSEIGRASCRERV